MNAHMQVWHVAIKYAYIYKYILPQQQNYSIKNIMWLILVMDKLMSFQTNFMTYESAWRQLLPLLQPA